MAMAEVADFHFSFSALVEDDEIETLASLPCWTRDFDDEEDDEDINPFDSDPDPDPFLFSDHSLHAHNIFEEEDEIEEQRGCIEIVGSDSDSDDQVNLAADLFERSTEHNDVDLDVDGEYEDFLSNPFTEEPFFRVADENNEVGNNYLELGLGLGLGFDRLNEEEDGEGSAGFMIEECGSEFFVGRRTETGGGSFGVPTVEQFGNCFTVEQFGDCLGIQSDSDDEEDFRDGEDDDDLGIPLCWDCLRLEDQRETNVEFEWEEVDERVDEREVLSMVIDVDEDIEISTEIPSAEGVEGREEIIRNLEWEVLLAVNNIERNPDLEHDVDHEDYIYPAEYEMVFGQFAENENALRGSPPAAKSVIENLPSIVLTQEDIQNKNGLCAVCKDEISIEESAKLLPCSHYYHGDCILPWLNIRNTCPVCRYELLTDDPEYERSRT